MTRCPMCSLVSRRKHLRLRVSGIHSLGCIALALLFVGCQGEPTPGAEEGESAGAPVAQSEVGSVAFPTSCSAQVQSDFEEAVAMLHSFWFEEAADAFRAVADEDPYCAMAYWGLAMNSWGNPMTRAAPSAERTQEAVQAVERTRDLGTDATERERMYIEAAAALWDNHDRVGHIERMRAHEEAMRAVMEAYPDDEEAAIFYARIVVGNAPPTDLTYSRQLHAAAILEPLLQAQPDHPGLAHYLIHAFDAPATAEEGLDAALRYADIAPAAPHALHMPTHIFTRLGYWEESVELNARSAQAEPNPDAAVHPLDYMVYAYLQLGMDEAAREVVERATSSTDAFYGGLIGYNFTAMQARFTLERDRWIEAAELPLAENVPAFILGVTRFARAVGAARGDRPEQAVQELAALAVLRDETSASGDDYWTTVLEAQRLAASAWLAHAEGNDEEALRLATEGAQLEATVEKHPVTPGPILPARELLADLLMELDRPADALRAYETTLEQEPRRARSHFGAARAAEAAEDAEAADRHYAALLDLLAGADSTRPDLRAAQEWTRGR